MCCQYKSKAKAGAGHEITCTDKLNQLTSQGKFIIIYYRELDHEEAKL